MPCVGKSEAPSPKRQHLWLFHDDSGRINCLLSYLKDPRQQIDYKKLFPREINWRV